MKKLWTRMHLVSGTSQKHSSASAAGVLCILLMAAILQACQGNPVTGSIQSVDLVDGQTLATGNALDVIVSGFGTCATVIMDWGDGTAETLTNVNLTAHSRQRHTYSGWGGGKTVTATGSNGCLGSAFTRFRITPLVYSLAVSYPGPNTKTCNAIPNRPALPMRTQVHAVNVPLVNNVNSNMINFGCPFNGCIYDPNGRPGSVAAAPFPFLGLREYSVVWTVGSSQTVQGGLDTTFTTTGSGNLSFCINADLTRNVGGGWQFDISVDSLGPPPP